MDEDSLGRKAEIGRQAQLLAVVAVDVKARVQCQEPGCGHSIHAAVHVVKEDGRWLVLGSTCFAKRYGSARALGNPQYGSGAGSGRRLNDEERLMLLHNTRALLARFEAQTFEEAAVKALAAKQAQIEELQRKQQIVEKLQRLKASFEDQHAARERAAGAPGLTPQMLSPWHWQMERTSIAVFTAPSGAYWVRVQHRDGSQKLVPWPQFDHWEHTLPAGVGVPDSLIGVVAVNSIVEAIQILRQNGFQGPLVGRWQDVLPRQPRR